MRNRFLTYTGIGIFNTILDICILFVLVAIFGQNASLNIISYSVGVASSFYLNSKITFKLPLTTNRFYKCYASSLFAILINTIVVFALLVPFGIFTTKIIAALVVLLYNYAVSVKFIFGDNNETKN
ncbi:GtrA family protein [Pedobacter sp.]|uniref:GtrA family protein n=1 Tax=Pedobacter sp. TaxID=1411316 RepID=UPI00356AB5E7